MHVRSGPGRGIWAYGCIHLFLSAQACCMPPAHVWDPSQCYSAADLLGKCIRPIPHPHQTPRQYPIGMAKRGMEGGAQRIPSRRAGRFESSTPHPQLITLASSGGRTRDVSGEQPGHAKVASPLPRGWIWGVASLDVCWRLSIKTLSLPASST
jgi:hypothetical protein